MKKILLLLFTATTFFVSGCAISPLTTNSKVQCVISGISEDDVVRAQKEWGEAIVAIGRAYTEKKNYQALAAQVINNLYAYDEGTVLFKPTKAVERQFRLNKTDAISYFVKGNLHEDHGFALQPWSKVRFENAGVDISSHSATAMGNYYFTDAKTGKDVKVEFTFGYIKDDKGKLLINLHHSSLPYTPQH
ncbi:hypothetical protein [Chromatium okenii]|jgi:hypothetical protein|uniref:Phosphoribosyl-AMP cyclohydrolase n=1 Tax=Chromatium okenii TaxID=61644 RepID=A0A2S7XUG9_9GAMM|nr:hypothetical protein [Chromatium okenii]PQJ97379.1 hypothetical protein CXB77_02315 [Chromatium okenii]